MDLLKYLTFQDLVSCVVQMDFEPKKFSSQQGILNKVSKGSCKFSEIVVCFYRVTVNLISELGIFDTLHKGFEFLAFSFYVNSALSAL